MTDVPDDIRQIASLFQTDRPITGIERIGDGHIHHSYRCSTGDTSGDGGHYVLQQFNDTVFTDPPAVSRNIRRVIDHIRAGVRGDVEVPDLVPGSDDRDLLLVEGRWWRLWRAVANTVPGPVPARPDDAHACGIGFGSFLRMTADMDPAQLSDTIPRFHDIELRLDQLAAAVADDVAGRGGSVRRELDSVAERSGALRAYFRALARTPARVTHNDTKFNNILLDAVARTPRAVIDLDTVMAGHVAYDFGDGVRTGAATEVEDTSNTDAMALNVEAFEGYADGFCSAAALDRDAREMLRQAAAYMTMIMAVRFLADYLNGDRYYHVDSSEQNLRRARAQLALLADIELQSERVRRVLR